MLTSNDSTHVVPFSHARVLKSEIMNFDILAKGKTDYHCKIKESLLIQELEPAFNVNVGSKKLLLY